MRTRIALIVALGTLAAHAFAADDVFFQNAARGGMAEVALGKLAAERAESVNVKAFGKRMVDEHGAANAKLQAAAAKSGVTLPTDLSADAQATQKELQALSGGDFDLAYQTAQKKAHEATIEMLEKEIASGTDPAAKSWAREALVTVKRHAELLGSLDGKPGNHQVEHALGTRGQAVSPPLDAPLGATPAR